MNVPHITCSIIFISGCNWYVTQEMIDAAGDRDGDGYRSVLVGGLDCDDADPEVRPGALEICEDNKDNDCNGFVDDIGEGGVLWYLDTDLDGYGSAESTFEACLDWNKPGWSLRSGDCDDHSAARNPGVGDASCNQLDDDCDGQVDEDAPELEWYLDTDGDGYGGTGQSVRSCSQVPGSVSNAGDCDDTNSDIYPGASDPPYDGVDADCGGDSDYDADGDGFDGVLYGGTDCDDAWAHVFPGGSELCDGLDGNCDGVVDSPPPPTAATWYIDNDQDGFGTASDVLIACDQPLGYVSQGTDCDDGSAAISPAQVDDDCDGQDNNCNAVADEDVPPSAYLDYHPDVDGDGFGAQGSAALVACSQPVAHVANADDCDDLNNTIHPLATEICDGGDNDCDGLVDEALPTEGTTLNGVNYALTNAIATAIAGDIIDICPGTWDVAPLSFVSGDDLTLRGVAAREDSILRSSTGETLLSATNATLLIDTLTITGTIDGTTAIDITDDSVITIRNAVIRDNVASGIRVLDEPASSLRIESSLIDGNSAFTHTGGGIHVFSDSHVTLIDTTISNNIATGGGGVWMKTTSTASLNMDSCIIESNETTEEDGGGLSILGTEAIIRSSRIANNTATRSGGGLMHTIGTLYMFDTEIENNTADYGGGLTSLNSAETHLETCSITNNFSVLSGGGTSILNNSSLRLNNVSVDENETLGDGGGAFIASNASLELLTTAGSTTITNNTATSGGGAFISADGSWLDSSGADWGTGSNDNTPNDVFYNNSTYNYAGPASFSCSSLSCL